MLQRIASRENERIKNACRLAGSSSLRQQQGLFFAEGKRLCLDVAAELEPQAVFCTEKLYKQDAGVREFVHRRSGYIISEPVDHKLALTQSPQGIYCLFRTPKAEIQDIRVRDGVLLCERIQDPSNVGAVLRSAAAFGFGGVVLSPGCADPFGPKALRSSMGAAVKLPVVQQADLEQAAEQLGAQGVTLYAAALRQAQPLGKTEVRHPCGLLVGNEGAGLSEQAVALADQRVYIPMQSGVESLNAAVAASVLMFHFRNQNT